MNKPEAPEGVEVFERGGEWWGRDDHGEFTLDSGSPRPVDREDDDLNYEPCNAVLKYTWERYGETRYCTGMAAGNFGNGDVREFPEFCKHHQGRGYMREHVKDSLKTGAFAQSYKGMFQKLQPHEQIMAIIMFEDLLTESIHDFNPDHIVQEIDATDAEWIDGETAEIEYAVPTENVMRSKALWFAALDFLRMEGVERQLFATAMEDDDLSVGEKKFVVAVTDDGEPIWAKDEHHLNLTLSRIVKDYEQHMRFGGVSVDFDAESGGGERGGDWVLLELPDEKEPEPEQQIDGAPTPFEAKDHSEPKYGK